MEKADRELKVLLLKLYAREIFDPAAVLDEIAQRGGIKVVPVLTTLATGDDAARRRGAIAALGRIPDPGVADLLRSLAISKPTNAEDSKAAMLALAAHGTNRAADTLFDLGMELPGEAGILAGKLCEERFPERCEFRRKLNQGRADASPEQAKDSELAELLAQLADSNLTQRRVRATLALAVLADPRCVPALEAVLGKAPPRVRRAAVIALGNLPCPASAHALARAVANQRLGTDARTLAIQGLVKHRSRLAASLLFEHALDTGQVYDSEVESFIELMLPLRVKARKAIETSPGAEVEVLVDLLQRESGRRRTRAFLRAGNLRADVLPALAVAMREPSVAPLSIAAVSQYGTDAAQEELARFAADSRQPAPLRLEALVSLAKSGTPKGGQLLVRMHNSTPDPKLQETVARLLTAYYPELARTTGLERIDKDRSGLVPMMIGCAGHGAVTMALVSDVVNPSPEKTMFLPVLGGAILGGGAPLLLTLDDEVHMPESMWVTTGGLWGLADGFLLALTLSSDSGDDDLRWAEGLGLLGQLGGLTTSWLTRDTIGRDAGMVGYMNASGSMGLLGGLGISLMLDDAQPSTMGGLMLTGNLGAMLAAGLLGETTEYSHQDYMQTASTMAMSGWAGGWLAEAANLNSDTAAPGGFLAGAALGFAGSSILAAYTEPDLGFIGLLDLAFVAGNLGGLGVGLQWKDLSAGEAGAWMVGGGAVSLLAAGTLGQNMDFTTDDKFATAASVGLGAWSGYWGLSALRPDHDTAADGGLLLGSALGFGAGVVLSAHTEIASEAMTRHLAGFATGSTFGAGLGLVIPALDSRYAEAFSLLGGWGVFAASARLDSAMTYSSGDKALLALGGGWGTWQGYSVWKAAGGEKDSTLAGATMLGVSTGLIGTSVLSQFMDWDVARVGRATSGGMVGSVIGHGLGMVVPELEDGGLWTLGMAGGWAGLIVEGLYVPPAEFTEGDYAAMVAGPLWGMAQGALIGHAAGLEDDRLQGAVMMGAGFGYLSGEAFARAGNLEFQQVMFTELASYSGTALGAGAVLVAEGSGRTVSAVSSLSGWGAKFVTGLMADRLAFQADDAWEYLLGQGFGAWQGLGYAGYADGSSEQIGGAMLMGMSVGYFLPMIVNQLHDYSSWDDLLIFGSAAWGTWLGGWLPFAASGSDEAEGMDGDPRLLAALIGGDVGFVAAGLALSPLLDISPVVVAWSELIGLGGMALGASGTAIFADNNEVIAAGQIIGSVAGLIGGAVLGLSLDDGEAKKRTARLLPETKESGARDFRLGRFEIPLVRPTTLIAPPPAGTGSAPILLLGLEAPLR